MTIHINHSTFWCEGHWNLVKKAFWASEQLVTILLMNRMHEDSEFQEACGLDKGKGEKARMSKAEENLQNFKPVCCHLGEEIVEQVILLASPVEGEA